MPKEPAIFCKKGKPLGEFRVKCGENFAAAVKQSEQHHGPKALRVYEAAAHLIQGLEHLIGTQGHDLADAYKVAAKAVQSKHGLNAAAFQEVVRVASQHWPRGEELSDVLLGRQGPAVA